MTVQELIDELERADADAEVVVTLERLVAGRVEETPDCPVDRVDVDLDPVVLYGTLG